MDVQSRAPARLVRRVVAERGAPARVEATLGRREAVRLADYVITTFQQGGRDACRLDIGSPRSYGVEQCVGDTPSERTSPGESRYG